MLALKTVLAERDHVPVLIFDEIDTGVGEPWQRHRKRLRLGAVPSSLLHHTFAAGGSQAHHISVREVAERVTDCDDSEGLDGEWKGERNCRMLGGVTITKKVRETPAELIAGALDEV